MPPATGSEAPERRRGGATAVAAGILASRVAGLARTAVIGSVFGVGPHADALQVALRGPNLLQNLLGEQALSASFIPVYSRLLAAGRGEAARRFAGAVFGLLLVLAAALSLLGVLAARPLVAVFAFGYLGDAAAIAAGEASVDRFELAVSAVRWIFPMAGLLVLSAWALGVLNSHRRFFLSYVAPVAWNAAIVGALAAALWSGRRGLDGLLTAACLGALAGGALQLLVQLPAVLRALGGLRIAFSLQVEGVREALRAFGPALAGRGVVQLSSYIDLVLATLLAAGAVSAIGYAQLLYLLPVSLFGQSIAAAALPELARATAVTGKPELAAGTRRALAQTGFLNLPTAAAYLFLGPLVVGALYRLLPGRFGVAESWLVGILLGTYALGLPASTGSRVLQTAFFALGDTRTPARVAAVRVAVGTALALPAMLVLDGLRLTDLPGLGALDGRLRLGALGLALGASVAAWLERALLGRALARRLPGHGAPRAETARVAAASLAGAGAGLGTWWLLAGRGLPEAVTAAAALAALGLVFLGAGLASGLPQLERMRTARRAHR